ncbi:hypothetical protein M501DRAFT_986736 [Patellaria atrata CBS 101060]|uniref:F-box domain-containing protein n=1 Tax=Patellaria atrata CBS 101060 TaxID=1346257 RepID=A0A9P4S708_9PEZI|nr:hypothetical protein M501DRAFT_986736 [Patellaria atrata CBS 101060]
MAKRNLEEIPDSQPPAKRSCSLSLDQISKLSDELLIHILSFVPVSTLIVCQRISHKFRSISGDSQLWKAAYYNRFVRPRAARLPTLREAIAPSDQLYFSSKLSKWLDEENLVSRGKETNWKRQYKLRHNWAKGSCDVREIEVTERPPILPLLVRLHEGIIYTVDPIAGLRVWSLKKDRKLLASTVLSPSTSARSLAPTSFAINNQSSDIHHEIIIGFEDGSFTIFTFFIQENRFTETFTHPASSNGMITALAYCSPYILTMTENQLLSLYRFSSGHESDGTPSILDPPQLLYSLKSHTSCPPLSLSIRPSSQSIIASIAYTIPTYISGWSVGIQEMCLTLSGDLIESRIASSASQDFQPLIRPSPFSAPSTRTPSPSARVSPNVYSDHSQLFTKPTSLSYTHPYLLVSHPDNTLTLYLVTSDASTLSISSGSRLWGHTSSVSGAYVGGKGKAVSVSTRGDELRVWELEGGLSSPSNRRRLQSGHLSVRIKPEQRSSRHTETNLISESVSQRGSGLGLALDEKYDDLSVMRGWVGFNEENVIVLREKSQGSQALVVYDFS